MFMNTLFIYIIIIYNCNTSWSWSCQMYMFSSWHAHIYIYALSLAEARSVTMYCTYIHAYIIPSESDMHLEVIIYITWFVKIKITFSYLPLYTLMYTYAFSFAHMNWNPFSCNILCFCLTWSAHESVEKVVFSAVAGGGRVNPTGRACDARGLGLMSGWGWQPWFRATRCAHGRANRTLVGWGVGSMPSACFFQSRPCQKQFWSCR